MGILLRGGSVVSGQGVRRADVLLEGEKIAAVGPDLPAGAGLSQQDLAERLDVSRQSISKWELGTALPSMDPGGQPPGGAFQKFPLSSGPPTGYAPRIVV